MFQIFDQRVEISINDLKGNALLTLLCGGIVNPFGPTLTATAFLGNLDRSVDLVEIMLNPIAQEAHRLGRATVGEAWNIIDDCDSLFEASSLRNCPTLFLPSAGLDDSDAVELHARWLCRFPDAGQRWQMIQKYRSNPWTRIDEEIKSGPSALESSKTKEAKSPLSKSEAIEFATFALSDEHMAPELQAFMFAWKGSIDFQSESGSGDMANTALRLEGFADWLGFIGRTCRFPAKPTD